MVSNGKLLSAPQLVNPSTIYTTVECVLEGKEKQHSSAPGRKWGGLWKTQGMVQGSQTPSRVPGTQMTHSLNPTNLFPIFWTTESLETSQRRDSRVERSPSHCDPPERLPRPIGERIPGDCL